MKQKYRGRLERRVRLDAGQVERDEVSRDQRSLIIQAARQSLDTRRTRVGKLSETIRSADGAAN